MTTLDLKQDHTAELLALRKEILQILDELQELYEDSIDDLEQIEETLHLY